MSTYTQATTEPARDCIFNLLDACTNQSLAKKFSAGLPAILPIEFHPLSVPTIAVRNSLNSFRITAAKLF